MFQYMGSIPVIGTEQAKRADFVRDQLEKLRVSYTDKFIIEIFPSTAVNSNLVSFSLLVLGF